MSLLFGKGNNSYGIEIADFDSEYSFSTTNIASPGHMEIQRPHPSHLSPSILGRFVIGVPTIIAPLGHTVSHGLHGISSTHSKTATFFLLTIASPGQPGHEG